MDSNRYVFLKLFSAVIFCLIAANLVFLDTIAWQTKNAPAAQVVVIPTIGPSQLLLTQTPAPAKPAPLTPTPSPTHSVQTNTVVQVASKEYFIPFGSATSSATDWQDVPGLQVAIDSTNYPHVKSALFEITLHNTASPQDVSARLYNATDKHPVWFSDVSYTGGNTAALLTSKPITLDPGSKVYTVQLKTQLQAPVQIDQSRLHITLQ